MVGPSWSAALSASASAPPPFPPPAALRAELLAACALLSERCLDAPAKWAAEQLTGLPEGVHDLPAEPLPAPPRGPSPPLRPSPAEKDAVALALPLIRLREFRRAAGVLSRARDRGAGGGGGRGGPSLTPRGAFMLGWSRYLAGRARAVAEAGAASAAAAVTSSTGSGSLFGETPPSSSSSAPALDDGDGASLEEVEADLAPFLGGRTRDESGSGSGSSGAGGSVAGGGGGESEAVDPFCLYLLGLAAADSGRPLAARSALLASVRLFPLNWGAWLALASLDAAERGGGGGGSGATSLSSSPSSPSASAAAAAAAAALPFGGLPNHWASHCYLAHVSADAGDDPADALSRARALAGAGGEGGGEGSDDSAPSGLPRSPFVACVAAGAHYANRNFDEAGEIYENGLLTDPHRLEGLVSYSNVLYVRGDSAALAALAAGLAKTAPFSAAAATVAGNYHSLRGDHGRALACFRRSLALEGASGGSSSSGSSSSGGNGSGSGGGGGAWTLMGHEYIELKNPAAAVASYRKAVSLAPRDHRAWYGLGQAYELLNAPHAALHYFRRAAALRPVDARMWVAVGQCLELLAASPGGTASEDGSREAQFSSSSLHPVRDASLAAKKAYRRAVDAGDGAGTALAALARIAEAEGDDAAAASYHEAVVAAAAARAGAVNSNNSGAPASLAAEAAALLDESLSTLPAPGPEEQDSLLFLAAYRRDRGEWALAERAALRLLRAGLSGGGSVLGTAGDATMHEVAELLEEGNGGTFALYSILRRQGIAPPPPASAGAPASAPLAPVAAAAAAAAASSAAAGAASAPADAKTNGGVMKKRTTLEDSSDAAVSAGISTFARGPETRRASVDSGGGGGAYSVPFARRAARASTATAGLESDDPDELSAAAATARRGAASMAKARSAPGRGETSASSSPPAAGGDVEAPPPPPAPSLQKPASFSFSSSAKAKAAAAAAAKKNDGKDWRQRLIEREGMQKVLKAMVVVGVGAVLGDGVLTPSMSVVSAFKGLTHPFPKAFAKGEARVVGLAAGILAVLFLCQRFGTAGVAVLFSPIAVAWCAVLAGIGMYNLVIVPPSAALSALSAVSPHHAVRFFVRNGAEGWRSLGSLALCLTGAEALFADLGHFNRKSITLATTALVYPSLILTYLGQAALLIHRPSTFSAPDGPPFWAAIPAHPAVYWPVLALTVAASIVASQALISAAFAIVKQCQCGFMPRLQVVHTSKHHEGQIYIPAINWALAILCLSVVLAFRDSNVIGDAYGIAVLADMLLTTCFMTLVFLTVWKVHILIPICFFACFSVVEGAFWSSSLLKVPGKGWFAILMAAIWASVMAVYAAGSATKRKALVSPPLDTLLATETTSWGSITFDTLELEGGAPSGGGKDKNASASSASSGKRDIAAGADRNHYYSSITVPLSKLRANGLSSSLSRRRRGAGRAAGGGDGGDSLDGASSGGNAPSRTRAVARSRGVAIFFSDALDATPPVLAHLIARVLCLFECNIFLTNRVVPVAEVPSAERLLARSQNVEGFFSVVARYGYLDRIKQDEEFASGVVAFVLGRLGRRICRAAGADDALREALGLPRERFARALASDLGLDLGGGADGSKSALLSSMLAPSSRTVASVADAVDDAEAAEAADREKELAAAAAAQLSSPGLETVVEGVPSTTTTAEAPPPPLPAPPAPQQQQQLPPEKQGDLALQMLWRALFRGRSSSNGGGGNGSSIDAGADKEAASPTPAPIPLAELAERYPAVAAAVAECRVLEYAARQNAVVFLVAAAKPSLGPVRGPLSFLRRVFVSAPYIFIVRNFQSDAVESFGIPRESTLEVVLPYDV